MNVLITAGSAEAPALVDALAASRCGSRVVAPDQDLTDAVAADRPDVVIASAAGVPDPIAFARRVRAAVAPAPLVLLIDPGMEGTLRPWADAVVLRPLGPHVAIERALATARGGGQAAVAADPLAHLAVSIDELLETEMHEAVSRAAPQSNELPTEVETSTASTAGDLSDEDIATLLGRAFTMAATGRLRIVRGEVEKIVCFEAGRPVYAASNDPQDRLVAMLAREGLLTTSQQEEAVRAADSTGKRMGALLVELGYLKPGELLVVVRRHYEQIVLSLFEWSNGAWTFEPGLVASPERVRLLRHPAALVREGLARTAATTGTQQLRAKLGSGRNVFRALTGPRAADLLADTLTNERERRLVSLFDGLRSVDEVARESSLPEAAVPELAYTLWCFGLIMPAGAAPARAGEERDRAIERARVLARHALAMEGDYFQVLGIDRLADDAEVRRAFERLTREMSASALDPAVATELSAELATIGQVLVEGARVLGDRDLRARYEAHLPESTAPTTGQPAAARAR